MISSHVSLTTFVGDGRLEPGAERRDLPERRAAPSVNDRRQHYAALDAARAIAPAQRDRLGARILRVRAASSVLMMPD